jgi:ethanolamine utilization microcompartment shell protein EutS
MEQILVYAGIALLAALVTVLLLFTTKLAIFVTLGSALIVGAIVVGAARVELGFWDPFAPIAFVANAAFAFAVSAAVLMLGRRLRWRFFLAKRQDG